MQLFDEISWDLFAFERIFKFRLLELGSYKKTNVSHLPEHYSTSTISITQHAIKASSITHSFFVRNVFIRIVRLKLPKNQESSKNHWGSIHPSNNHLCLYKQVVEILLIFTCIIRII